jgi:putative ABC transport system substrate-binding protein
MRRREFLTLLGGTAAAWPLAGRAQQPAIPIIGYLSGGGADTEQALAAAFQQSLSEAGYTDGRNVAIVYRWAEGRFDRVPAMAAELVSRPVTAIVAGGNTAVLAAKAATKTIPIIFQTGADPVQMGFVSSLNRPGGNLTGVTSLNLELAPKRLELLRELAPGATLFALLVNPTNAAQNEPVSKGVQAAARALRLDLRIVMASTERELDTVFTTLVELRAGGLVIAADALINTWSKRLVTLAALHAVPVVYPFQENAVAGGLMSYGAGLVAQYRTVGVYAGRVLKGEKPTDLPVQQATKVELIINLKTAKALGLTVPLALLTRADEVIE